MAEALNFFAKFTNETLFLLVWLALGTSTGLILYWVNRRKRGEVFTHEIPFQVVDSYLKADGSAPGSAGRTYAEGMSVPGGAPLASLEEKRLQNEVMALTLKIQEQTTLITKLTTEGGSAQLSVENNNLKQQIESLKAGGEGGINPDLQRELDALKNKLKEYEIIEDDLAQLKELQDENRQLKERLGGQQQENIQVPSEEPSSEVNQDFTNVVNQQDLEEPEAESNTEKVESTPEISDQDISALEAVADEAETVVQTSESEVNEGGVKVEEEPEDEGGSTAAFEAADEAAPIEEVTPEEEENLSQIEKDGEEKSAEELLSEFEKMLG